jgi:hypothetical protein
MDEKDRRPDFARGEDLETPDEEVEGDFAEGQEAQHHAAKETHEGTFGSGQEDEGSEPIEPRHGDFAEGQEEE